jgi:hypothetical protein
MPIRTNTRPAGGHAGNDIAPRGRRHGRLKKGPGSAASRFPADTGKRGKIFFVPSPSAENLSDLKSLNTTLAKNRRPGREPAGKRESRRMATITGTAFL